MNQIFDNSICNQNFKLICKFEINSDIYKLVCNKEFNEVEQIMKHY